MACKKKVLGPFHAINNGIDKRVCMRTAAVAFYTPIQTMASSCVEFFNHASNRAEALSLFSLSYQISFCPPTYQPPPPHHQNVEEPFPPLPTLLSPFKVHGAKGGPCRTVLCVGTTFGELVCSLRRKCIAAGVRAICYTHQLQQESRSSSRLFWSIKLISENLL